MHSKIAAEAEELREKLVERKRAATALITTPKGRKK